MGIIVRKDMEAVDGLIREKTGAEGFCMIERLGGLTNHTYHVVLEDGREYAVRIPGEGTEEMIVRSDEKVSTELACRLGVDAQLLFFGDDGTKLTEFIKNGTTMSADSLKDPARIRKMAEIFRVIHDCGEDTGVPFEVFDMAAGYEKIIRDLNVPMFADYQEKKAEVMAVKEQTDREADIRKVPCHNDPLCQNWVEAENGRLYLIDWEYAGMNDGMWDLADISIEAEFNEALDDLLLEDYFGKTPARAEKKHFLASKIYVDYLWTLWAKTRVPFSGQDMEDWAQERYARMKGNLEAFAAL